LLLQPSDITNRIETNILDIFESYHGSWANQSTKRRQGQGRENTSRRTPPDPQTLGREKSGARGTVTYAIFWATSSLDEILHKVPLVVNIKQLLTE
jgi:hypothetical protein